MDGGGEGWKSGGVRGGGLALVIVDYISEVVSAAVVGFAHAHGVVGEIDIAVVALRELAWRKM